MVLRRTQLNYCSLIPLCFISTSIDPIKGHVELSLKGTDVGGPDPAPKPKRWEEKEKRDKEKKQKRKRKKENDSETKDESDNEAEEILKKLKTGK